ncbi:MAG: DUF2809 domain-containing protein [Cyanobacteria bacterium P01_H01_bin.15]
MPKNLLLPVSLAILVILGLASKRYQGWEAEWVNHFAGDILYVLFWVLLAAWIFPGQSRTKLAGIVLAVTCLIEALQLLQTEPIVQLRSTWWGPWLLGTTFSWADFVYYALGGILAWLWLGWLRLNLDQSRPR